MSVVEIPAGVTVDAVRYREDMAATGQHIKAYTLEMATGAATAGGAVGAEEWKPIEAAAGGTIGPQLIDLIPLVTGPARLRWRCGATLPAGAPTRLTEFAAFKLAPPAGWRPPALTTSTWALQTLYTPVGEDMTPCATRSRPTLGMTAAAASIGAVTRRAGRIQADAARARDTGSSAAGGSDAGNAEGADAGSATTFWPGHLGENRSSCSAYMTKPGYKYAHVRDEHCCFLPPGAPPAASGLVPLYLLFSPANNDHLVASRRNYSAGGASYSGSSSECWGYRSNATGTLAPLDLYWSAARKDTWSLSSDASRAEALASGYVFVETTAYVPSECA